MRDVLHDYLLDRPSGASPRELIDLIFTHPGADPEFGPRFLTGLLGADTRFLWRENDGVWVARAHELRAQPLHEATFVVVDVETTGGAASASGLIEVAAARVRQGRVEAEFQQLINPGVRLPRFITGLTGIDDAMLADAPPIAAVWPRIVEFLHDATVVAHNAAFDMSFLDAASLACTGARLPNARLCTLRLARRALPQLRRRSLDALGAHFGIPLIDRHRALGDVRITVEVLFQLLELLAARNIRRLDQLLDLQHHARDGRHFVCPLPRDKVAALPERPGIYHFYGADGRLLYIGKAKNLRERVGSYLSNTAAHSNKTLDLVRHAHDVRVVLTGSELDAALAEAEAIRRHQPPYNRLGKHLPRIAFIKLTTTDVFPRVHLTTRLGRGRGRYIGPFRSREQADQFLGLLTRQLRLRRCAGRLHPDPAAAPCFQGQIGACSAPCAARVDAAEYAAQVAECLELLDGQAAPVRTRIEQRRDTLAAELRFEAAARAQRDLELLDTLLRRQRLLGWMVAQQNFLILQPSVDRDAVLAYVVVAGRLVMRRRLVDACEIDALAEAVQRERVDGPPRALAPDDVDGTTIVAAWLRDRGETDGCVLRIEAEGEPATQLAEWRAACASLLPPVDGALRREMAPAHPEQQRNAGERPQAVAAGAVAD